MAAIAHAVATRTAQISKTGAGSDAYSDVLSMPSTDFVAGKKYLLLLTGQMNGNSSAGQFCMQAAHGGAAFAGSEYVVEPAGSTSTMFMTYCWFTVWTAVASEAVAIQYKNIDTARTIIADQCCIVAICLSDDLVENTDWFFNELTSPTTLSTTFQVGATKTFTPANAGDRWLVMTTARLSGVSVVVNYESRMSRSGEASSLTPLCTGEGENAASLDRFLFTHWRAFTLGAASNTFREESRIDAAGTTEARTYSAVFALNLAKFKDSASVYTEGGIDLSQASIFATNVQTLAFTPSQSGDCVALGSWDYFPQATGSTTWGQARMQIDNVDALATETADAYDREAAADAKDQLPVREMALTSLTAAAHTIDVDGSTNLAAAGNSAINRSIVAFSMELFATPAAALTGTAVSGMTEGNMPGKVVRVTLTDAAYLDN